MIGLPYFCLQAASSVYTAVVNNRLAPLGTSMDLAVFAIINGYVIYVLMLFVAAFSYATQTIASFNNGARNWGRLAELVRVQLVYEVVFMAVCSALVLLIPGPIVSIFAATGAALIEVAAPAVRIRPVSVLSLGLSCQRGLRARITAAARPHLSGCVPRQNDARADCLRKRPGAGWLPRTGEGVRPHLSRCVPKRDGARADYLRKRPGAGWLPRIGEGVRPHLSPWQPSPSPHNGGEELRSSRKKVSRSLRRGAGRRVRKGDKRSPQGRDEPHRGMGDRER